MRLLWVLLLFIPLSGCITGTPGETMLGQCERPTGISNTESRSRDWSLETLHITIDGPHDVLLPVPVNRATTAAQWAAVADAEVIRSEHGDMLHLVGDDAIDTTLCIVQPAWGGNNCCAEHFIDSRWTSDPDREGTIWALPGDRTVTVSYEAVSDWCGIDAQDGTWTVSGADWQTASTMLGAWCA